MDVGIGTAAALLASENANFLVQKNLTVVGIDYDDAYIDTGKHRLASMEDDKIRDRVALYRKSIYDPDLAPIVGGIDVVYFSGSFTLLPEPGRALTIAAALLSTSDRNEKVLGRRRIYITQTFQRVPSPITAVVKPLLKYLLRIDFGKLTYEADLHEILEAFPGRLAEKRSIPGRINTAAQQAQMIVLEV